MKQVWILNHYAQHPGGAGGTRHYSLARHLPTHGWQASIIASSIEHGIGQQRLADGEPRRLDVLGGVPFLWLRGSAYSGNGADRIGNMIGYTLGALRRNNLKELTPPDAVIGSSVHPLAAWAGLKLARRHRVPFLFEVRDLWPETLIEMGRLKRDSAIARALRGLEKHLYVTASKIITLLPRAGDYIERFGVTQDKIVWVPNGVELDGNIATPPPEQKSFTLMYFGAHGGANGLENVIRAMRSVADSPQGNSIRFRLIGDGPLKPALIDLAREIGATNVSFEPPVAKSAIPTLAAEADAFVFNLIDAPVFKYGISSNKLFDFMAAQRPILFCCNAANNPVADAGAGLTVPPAKPEKLAAAILDLAYTPHARRAEMGFAARRHVEKHYNFEHLAAKLAGALDACIVRD